VARFLGTSVEKTTGNALEIVVAVSCRTTKPTQYFR